MDDDNNWGNKKDIYYIKNKGEEYDFLEEDEEAQRIQKLKLKKYKDVKLLESDEEQDNISEKADNDVQVNNIFDSEDEEQTKKLSTQDIEDLKSKLILLQANLNEINDKYLPILEIINSYDEVNTINTKTYLMNKKQLLLLYCTLLTYFIYQKSVNKINDHHPVNKKLLYLENLLEKNHNNDKQIFTYLNELLININSSAKLTEINSSNVPEAVEILKPKKITKNGKAKRAKDILNINVNDLDLNDMISNSDDDFYSNNASSLAKLKNQYEEIQLKVL